MNNDIKILEFLTKTVLSTETPWCLRKEALELRDDINFADSKVEVGGHLLSIGQIAEMKQVHKIGAIKLFRNWTGVVSLKEAKDAIDAWGGWKK